MNGLPLRRSLRRLAAALHRGRRSAAPFPRHGRCLVLESLEGRWVPSTVMNLNDAGAGSLRQAILDTPAGGTVDFQPGLSGTITLTSGELAITHDLTISGPGASAITVSGNHASRVFDINATSTVTISGLTIADGSVSGINGGGIYNLGTLTVTSCALSGSSAAPSGIRNAALGGGIFSAGTLTLISSTVSGNSATVMPGSNPSGGGGIYSYGPTTVTSSILNDNSAQFGGGIDFFTSTLTITDSTLSGNHTINFGSGGGIAVQQAVTTLTDSIISGNSAGAGGGIYYSYGTLTITSSTISGNSGSGIYYDFGTVTITGSTISGNSTTGPGGGIDIFDSSFRPAPEIKDTIVAGNTGVGSPDVNGPVNSQGHNLIGDGTGSSGFDPSDLVGTSDSPIDALLGPLADNGGPTQTRALLPGSPAIDAGDNTNAPRWDQRGPGFPRIVNGTIDIGAFEVQAHPHGPPARRSLPNPVPVQLLGTPAGSVVGQPPDLPADPSSLPDAGVPEGPADLPGSGPDLALTADGQAVDAVLAAAADPGPAGACVGPWPASDLAPLAGNLLVPDQGTCWATPAGLPGR